jgi:hypothetical protein
VASAASLRNVRRSGPGGVAANHRGPRNKVVFVAGDAYIDLVADLQRWGVASTTDWGLICFDLRMAERVQVRELTNDEGRKLLSIVRRGSGSVVRWRRAQIVVWSRSGWTCPPSPRSHSPQIRAYSFLSQIVT